MSIFILISGYFGIQTSVERVLKLELKVWIYSVIQGIIIYILIDNSIMRLIKSAMPIVTNKYWFLTGYMLLMIFAPFINCAIEKMSKVQYKKLLIIMLVVFFAIPTILYFDILGDNGKNIINMLFIYLLGGYLRKYPEDTFEQRVYRRMFIIAFVFSFILNIGMSVLTNGVHCPMSRDCSVFVVLEAVSIFMLFKNITLKSPVINSLAKHVIAVYMLESLVRKLIELFVFDYTQYYDCTYWFVVNIILAIITVAICIIVDYLRDFVLDNIEDFLIKKLKSHINLNKV